MNPNDERIKQLEAEKDAKLSNISSTYDKLLQDNQELLNRQNSFQDEYLAKQNELADRNLDLLKGRNEQRKTELEEAYEREAMASELDYQKFINPYGAQAEQLARAGLSNTGYAESTKLGAYNVSRNRIAMARATAEKNKTELDLALQEAILQHDVNKANIALQVYKEKLANELQSFMTTINLTQTRMTQEMQMDDRYYSRIQDVYADQRYQSEREEEARRYQEQLSYQREQDRIAQQRWEQEMAYQKQQDAIRNAQTWATINQKNSSVDFSEGSSSKSNQYTSKYIEDFNQRYENLYKIMEQQRGKVNKEQLVNVLISKMVEENVPERDIIEFAKQHGVDISKYIK